MNRRTILCRHNEAANREIRLAMNFARALPRLVSLDLKSLQRVLQT